MPDLPEVEVLRTFVSRDFSGKKIKSVAVNSGKVVARHKTARDFRAAVEGLVVKSVDRLGRSLVLSLDNNSSLVLTLNGEAALLRSSTGSDAKPKYTAVVIAPSQGAEYRVVDPHGEVEMYVTKPPSDGDAHSISKYAQLAVELDGLRIRRNCAELADVGVDMLVDQMGWDRFAAIVRSRPGSLGGLLADEAIVTALGSLYIAESLYTAGLRANRATDSLLSVEARRLHRAITEVMAEAVKLGGASVAGHVFTDPDGQSGTYGNQIMVFGRVGEPCRECRSAIVEVEGIATCLRCQG